MGRGGICKVGGPSGQMYMSEACGGCRGPPMPGRCESCHVQSVCARGMRSRVLGAARECLSVSSPSRALGVVVSHGLSLQRQLSCSFPQNFTPHPAMHHPPPLQDLYLCFSLPSPCPAQLSPRGRESSTSAGSALQLPALSH